MAQTKPFRDYIYLGLMAIQLVAIIAMDSIVFYPSWLWRAPDAPLHFFVTVRETYSAFSGDPFYSHDITNPTSARPPHAWFDAFLLIQMFGQFPIELYLLPFLGSRRALTAPAELAALVHGLLVACTTGPVIYESMYFTEADMPMEKKNMLIWGLYFPFCLIPAVMTVDMYMRLLARLRVADKAKKTQ